MNNKKEKLARFGIATKGGVYCLIGVLTAMSALGTKGSDAKGLVSRIGYASSGVFYGFLAFTAFKTAIGAGSGSSGNGNESFVATLLGETYGQILVGVLGVVFLGKAAYQLWRAYSEKFCK